MTYDLGRFLEAQQHDYDRALTEMQRGRKTSHWMWYIFPQRQGLGHSANAQYYGLAGPGEAAAYLAHPVLGRRLMAITEVVLQHPEKTALEIFGHPDNLKFHSCMSLFAQLPEAPEVFQKALAVFFDGRTDATSREHA